MARRRVFPSIGPGLRALRHGRDGKYYLLASPNVGIAVFDSKEKQLTVIGAPPTSPASDNGAHPPISFGEDCDVDAQGNLYVADRGYNMVNVFSPAGALLRSMQFNSPTSLAALPEGEVAVTAPRGLHLVTVFGPAGRVVREFGDPEQLSERNDLNRYVSIGRLASDPDGHIYYGYTYLPESLVRQYDRFGFAKQDFQFTSIDAFSEARARRREIEHQEKRAEPPSLRPILTAFGSTSTRTETGVPSIRFTPKTAHVSKQTCSLSRKTGCSSAPIRSACMNSPGRTGNLDQNSPGFPQLALH